MYKALYININVLYFLIGIGLVFELKIIFMFVDFLFNLNLKNIILRGRI